MKNKKVYPSMDLFLAIIAFILLATIGCSKEEDPADDNTNPNIPTADPEINDYIVQLPLWDEFSPYKDDEELVGDPVLAAFDCDDQLVETTTPCSITRTPLKIVTFDPGSEILYLGSLIQGDGYTGDDLGSIQSLPIYQRAPITVTINVATPDNSRVVENPGLASVNSAINELILVAQNSGVQTASSIFFDIQTCHSVEQLALSLGLSYKKLRLSVSSDLAWVHDKEKNRVAAYFKQEMFTISMENPQRPGDLFSADFTQELLDEQISLGRIGPDNLPVYVSNIVYGRMMLFTMTSTHRADSMGFALDARRNGANGSINAEYQKIIDNSTFTLTTVGGDAQAALDFISTGNYGDFFAENPALTTAKPISYTLRNLADNKTAKVSETTEYDMMQYEPISVATYTNEGAWKLAVQSQMAYQKWECLWPNVFLADEHDIFDEQGDGQWQLGKTITLHGDQDGAYPFSFYLENMDAGIPPGDLGALVFHDNEGFSTNSISIGDIDNWEDDDFEIGVTGAEVYAIAFYMEDNEYDVSEYLEVHALDGAGECIIGSITEEIDGFFGVISPVPLKRIWFNENAGADDIALKDLYFGYRTD